MATGNTPSSYTVDWYNNTKTIIVMRVIGALSWDDYRTGVFCVRQMMQSVCHTVHFVYALEYTANDVIPQVGALEHFTESLDNQAENHGYRVIANAPMLVKMTIQLALLKNGHFSKNQVYFTDTFTEAIQFLERKLAR